MLLLLQLYNDLLKLMVNVCFLFFFIFKISDYRSRLETISKVLQCMSEQNGFSEDI